MIYIDRDSGKIVGSYAQKQYDGQESISELDAEYLAFVNGNIKQIAKDRIDAAAEGSRLQFITAGAGQSIVYDLKRAESEKYLAATNPVDADYPLMLERATRKGVALSVIANEWKTQSDALVSLAATIEGLREGAKDAIDAVADDANAQTNIDAIVNGITWPSPA